MCRAMVQGALSILLHSAGEHKLTAVDAHHGPEGRVPSREPSHSAVRLSPGPHLHREDEPGAVEGVLSVQRPIQGQRSADVVQREDAVGVP